jgi:hypothetical protein
MIESPFIAYAKLLLSAAGFETTSGSGSRQARQSRHNGDLKYGLPPR